MSYFVTNFFNYFVASKTESQGVPVPSPSQSPEAAKANAAPAPAASQSAPVAPSSQKAAKANAAPAPAPAVSSEGVPVPSPSRSQKAAKANAAPASQSAPVAPSSRKAAPAPAASSQGASASTSAPDLSDFKNKCVEVMFAWGSLDGEYSGYADNFYDLLETFIAHGDEAHDDKAIEEFLCGEGISAYMKGYVSSEASVYFSDAANWLKVLALPSSVRIDYVAEFPNAWNHLMTEHKDDGGAVTKVLRQRRAQLQRKQNNVIKEFQVSFIINYAMRVFNTS